MMKIVALDLDRTSLNDRQKFSPEDRRALRAFCRQGHLVALASGRMTDSVRPFARLLGLDTPIIAYNGAMVRDCAARGSRVLYHEPLPARYGDALLEFSGRRRIQINYYLDDRLYSRQDPLLRKYTKIYNDQTKSGYHLVPDLERFRGRRPTKVILITEPEIRNRLYREFRRRWSNRLNIVRTNPEYLEFMSPKADKGLGLRALAHAYGVRREDTIAFGDGDNDVPMLKWAGVGVAVANAGPSARAAADLVTRATNNQSPLAEALKRLGFLPSRP